MSLNRQALRRLTILLCALALFGLVAGGCKKKGSSGLTFYEFLDPT
ncbi:MAG: hypothetical protein ABH838_04740 [Actinomycetota bacterium]